MRKTLLLLILTLFSFSAIHADDFEWNLSNDGTLTISGTIMPDYEDYRETPWYSRNYKIKKVVIKDGMTNIGKNAFSECPILTSIEIPNSVKSIGESAFYDCTTFYSVIIPNSVTSIGSKAFSD